MGGRAEKSRVKPRMSAEDRRDLIIVSAIPLFARVGFKGVTTKMLAQEAGVSEALLYQHFPSKEALYAQVQDYVCRPNMGLAEVIAKLEPGTSKFIHLIVLMVKFIFDKPRLAGGGHVTEIQTLFPRIMINSVLEDGVFARMHMDRYLSQILNPMKEAFEVARAKGELLDERMPDDVRFWLCQHTIVALNLFALSGQSLIDYKCDHESLMHAACRYMLRGIGVTDAAMRQYFDFPKISATIDRWLEPHFKG